jgi:hypothetical protein
MPNGRPTERAITPRSNRSCASISRQFCASQNAEYRSYVCPFMRLDIHGVRRSPRSRDSLLFKRASLYAASRRREGSFDLVLGAQLLCSAPSTSSGQALPGSIDPAISRSPHFRVSGSRNYPVGSSSARRRLYGDSRRVTRLVNTVNLATV